MVNNVFRYDAIPSTSNARVYREATTQPVVVVTLFGSTVYCITEETPVNNGTDLISRPVVNTH